MNWYKFATFYDFTRGGFSDHQTEIFVNPSMSEWNMTGPARIIVDPNNGDVYAASDMESTHFDIRQTLDIVGVEGYAYIQGDNVLFDLRTHNSDWLIELIKKNIPNAISKNNVGII